MHVRLAASENFYAAAEYPGRCDPCRLVLSRYYSSCVSDVKYSSFTMITSMLSTSINCNTQPNNNNNKTVGPGRTITFNVSYQKKEELKLSTIFNLVDSRAEVDRKAPESGVLSICNPPCSMRCRTWQMYSHAMAAIVCTWHAMPMGTGFGTEPLVIWSNCIDNFCS